MNKRIVITMDILDSLTQKDLLAKVSEIQQAVVGLFDQVNITIMAGEVSSRDVGEVPPRAECDCPVCTARRNSDPSNQEVDAIARKAAYLTILAEAPEVIKSIRELRDDEWRFDQLISVIEDVSPIDKPDVNVSFNKQMVKLAAQCIFLDEDGDQ